MKEYHEMKPREQKKEMSKAKMTRLKNASSDGAHKKHAQKIREKAYKASKNELSSAHAHMKKMAAK